MGPTVMNKKMMKSCRRTRSRRSPVAGIRRRAALSTPVERRVRALKKLIPNGESLGTTEGLFRETADYIMGLEMRVTLMQIMLQGLTTTPPAIATTDSYDRHQFRM